MPQSYGKSTKYTSIFHVFFAQKTHFFSHRKRRNHRNQIRVIRAIRGSKKIIVAPMAPKEKQVKTSKYRK